MQQWWSKVIEQFMCKINTTVLINHACIDSSVALGVHAICTTTATSVHLQHGHT